MRYILVFFSLVFSVTSFSQKMVAETLSSKGVNVISINAETIFKIEVETSSQQEIQINALFEGETFETLNLFTAVENGVLIIEPRRSLDFQVIDDKLAAHKVISIQLVLTIPEGLEFWVDSPLASVVATGNYKYIDLNLGGGNCNLFRFRGSGIIRTRKGYIQGEVRNVMIEAQTRNGVLEIDNYYKKTNTLKLQSIDGDISIKQYE